MIYFATLALLIVAYAFFDIPGVVGVVVIAGLMR